MSLSPVARSASCSSADFSSGFSVDLTETIIALGKESFNENHSIIQSSSIPVLIFDSRPWVVITDESMERLEISCQPLPRFKNEPSQDPIEKEFWRVSIRRQNHQTYAASVCDKLVALKRDYNSSPFSGRLEALIERLNGIGAALKEPTFQEAMGELGRRIEQLPMPSIDSSKKLLCSEEHFLGPHGIRAFVQTVADNELENAHAYLSSISQLCDQLLAPFEESAYKGTVKNNRKVLEEAIQSIKRRIEARGQQGLIVHAYELIRRSGDEGIGVAVAAAELDQLLQVLQKLPKEDPRVAMIKLRIQQIVSQIPSD